MLSLYVVPKWDYYASMRIISSKTLKEYGEANPLAKPALDAWAAEARAAKWESPADIKAKYRNASFVGNNRVIFNIKGNDYRLVVAVAYQMGSLFIKFVGTHKEYDAIKAESVEL